MDILQAMQMDHSTLYMYQGFGRGGGSSGGGGLGGRGHMRPWMRGGWQRGQQWQGTSPLSYRLHLAVGGRCGHMILNAHPNRGDGVLCRWWRRTLLVAEAKREVGKNCEEV